MMPRRTLPQSVALLGVLALTLAAPAMAAQAKVTKPASAPAPATVPMPKTDRMPMATFKALLAKGEVVIIDVRIDGCVPRPVTSPGALSIPESVDQPRGGREAEAHGQAHRDVLRLTGRTH
jgi:hypothetical protein